MRKITLKPKQYEVSQENAHRVLNELNAHSFLFSKEEVEAMSIPYNYRELSVLYRRTLLYRLVMACIEDQATKQNDPVLTGNDDALCKQLIETGLYTKDELEEILHIIPISAPSPGSYFEKLWYLRCYLKDSLSEYMLKEKQMPEILTPKTETSDYFTKLQEKYMELFSIQDHVTRILGIISVISKLVHDYRNAIQDSEEQLIKEEEICDFITVCYKLDGNVLSNFLFTQSKRQMDHMPFFSQMNMVVQMPMNHYQTFNQRQGYQSHQPSFGGDFVQEQEIVNACYIVLKQAVKVITDSGRKMDFQSEDPSSWISKRPTGRW